MSELPLAPSTRDWMQTKPAESALRHRWLHWGLVAAVWTVLGLLEAGQTYVSHAYLGQPLAWWRALVLGLSEWYTWALLALLIFALGRRFPLDRRRWRTSLPIHLAAGPVFALIQLAIDVPVIGFINGGIGKTYSTLELYQLFLSGKFVSHVLTYWAILGLQHVLAYARRFHERELRASQLEFRLAQAQLQALRAELHPHFLFNALNTISVLVLKDRELAHRMVARLGDLLRRALDSDAALEVPLRRELEFVRAYLEIEQARLGPRLSVHLNIDPDVLDAQVPNLVLQPLVENAIRHGIAPRLGPGRLEVRARRAEDVLWLQVADDGPGLPEGLPESGGGIGLANTRARLRQLYGDRHRFELDKGPDGGLLVTVRIPFRKVEENAPGQAENNR